MKSLAWVNKSLDSMLVSIRNAAGTEGFTSQIQTLISTNGCLSCLPS
jgi:hypothetical protein